MNKNDKCKVRLESVFHAGKIGYFQFYSDEDTAILSTEPVNGPGEHTYFAVDVEYVYKAD